MSASDYPGYHDNPKIKELIDRCIKLSIPTHNEKTGVPYAESTLRSRCLVRKLTDGPIHARGSRGPSMISTDTKFVPAVPSAEAVAAARAALSGKVSSRKAPTVHAADTPVGTEMIGNDGQRYIVALRSNGTHYWKPCSNRGAGCVAGGAGQHGSGCDQRGGCGCQIGGSAIWSTLVPLGVLWGAYEVYKTQRTGQQRGGGGGLIETNLMKYAELMGIVSITPQTMVPLALILGQRAFAKYLG